MSTESKIMFQASDSALFAYLKFMNWTSISDNEIRCPDDKRSELQLEVGTICDKEACETEFVSNRSFLLGMRYMTTNKTVEMNFVVVDVATRTPIKYKTEIRNVPITLTFVRDIKRLKASVRGLNLRLWTQLTGLDAAKDTDGARFALFENFMCDDLKSAPLGDIEWLAACTGRNGETALSCMIEHGQIDNHMHAIQVLLDAHPNPTAYINTLVFTRRSSYSILDLVKLLQPHDIGLQDFLAQNGALPTLQALRRSSEQYETGRNGEHVKQIEAYMRDWLKHCQNAVRRTDSANMSAVESGLPASIQQLLRVDHPSAIDVRGLIQLFREWTRALLSRVFPVTSARVGVPLVTPIFVPRVRTAEFKIDKTIETWKTPIFRPKQKNTQQERER